METASQIPTANLTPDQIAARQALIAQQQQPAAPVAAPVQTVKAAAPVGVAPAAPEAAPSAMPAAPGAQGAPGEDHFLSDLYKKRIQDYEAKKNAPAPT